jgi:DMSO/TMAO reductase YedYZ molybdopterin-dependent catalytic subunit
MITWKSDKEELFRLAIDGLVEEKLTLTYEELKKFPQVTQVSDFHCVEGWSVADIKWGGIRFSELLKSIKVKPQAKFITFHSLGETSMKPGGQSHYVESFPIDYLIDPGKECLLALNMNDKPLPHLHGAPLRVVAPYELAYKNIKYVARMELSDTQQKGWWTLANPIYPVDAPVPRFRLRKKK